jgi:DNA-binding MarR family transcriptional regulator
MSVKVINAVFDLPPAAVTPGERLVLLALAWHADEHGRNAWPALSTLARRTSYDRTTVLRTLSKLKDKKLVVSHGKGPRSSVRYTISIDGLDLCTAHKSDPLTCALCTSQNIDSGITPPPPLHYATGGVALRHPIRPLTVLEEEKERSGFSEAASPPQLSGKGTGHEPKLNGNGNGHGHGPNGHRPSVDAPSPVDPLERLERIARESFAALGLYASPSELQTDFVARARTLGVPLDDDLNVPLFLWKFKQALKQTQLRQVQ